MEKSMDKFDRMKADVLVAKCMSVDGSFSRTYLPCCTRLRHMLTNYQA